MNLFQLFGTIAIQNKDANEALNETGKEGEKTESKLSGAFSKIGSAALACGKVIATGLAAGAAAFGALTIKALNVAGELEQNMGGSEAVFGEHAAKMQKTAESAFSNMGLSASDFLATANKMGSLFKGAGFEAEEASEITATAMQRAADVASIMGLDVSVAMESIAGAAKGNFTMMDNLGVAMNDNTLQAYAYAQGIDKATKDMTNQEKIGLAMQMFLEKTADYAGNYAKENDTLAGSLTTAKAALSNFLAGVSDAETLGDTLISTGNVIAAKLTDLLPSLVTGITNLVNKLIPEIPPLLEKVLPGVINGAVVLLKGLVKALPSLAKNLISSLFKSFGTELSNQLGNSVGNAIESVLGALSKVAGIIMDALGKLLPVVSDVLDLISEGIDTLTESESLGQGICDIIDAVINLVKKVVDVIKGFAQKTKPIVEFITDSTGWIFSGIAAIIDVVAEAVEILGDFFGLTSYIAEPAYKLSEAEAELADQAERARKNHEDLMGEFENNAQAIEEEAQRTRDLWGELQTLCDANGYVTDANAERVGYILNELNNAVGTEMQLVDGQIIGYQTLASEIENVIQKKQAEALVGAYSSTYENALANVDAYKSTYYSKQDAYDEEMAAIAAAQSEWDAYTTNLGELADLYAAAYEGRGVISADNMGFVAYRQTRDEYEGRIARESEALEALVAAEKNYLDAVETIYQYETAVGYIAEGNYESAIELYDGLYTSIEKYRGISRKLTEDEIAELQVLYDQAKRDRDDYWKHFSEGRAGFSAEGYNELQSYCNEIEGLLLDTQAEVAEAEAEIVEGSAENANRIARDTYDNGILPINRLLAEVQRSGREAYEDGRLVGQNIINGVLKGMEEREPWMVTAAGSVAYRALDAMKTVAEIRSPSRVTRGFGRYLMEGLALGIEDEADMAVAAAESAAFNTLDAMSMDFGSANIPSVDHVISGAVDTKQELRSLIESLPDLITYAISNGLSLNINNREFARMVKAVT